MFEFIKYTRQITINHILFFILKIGLILLCRYLLEHPPHTIFSHKFSIQALQGASFFLIINVIISILALFVKSIYAVNKHITHPHDKNFSNFILGIKRLVTMLNVILVIVSIMITISINPLQFVTSISIAAAAFALLSKDYITNMINGLIIMFSNKLLLGDYIVVDHTKGKIIDITFLNVVLLDEEGDTHFIPNTVMLSQPIINNSRVQYKKSFLDFDVDNLLGLNTHYFQERLEVAMAPFKEYIEPNSFTIKPKKIESDNIKYRLIFHIKNEEIFRDKTIKKTLLDAIINIITEHYKDVRKYAQN